MKLGKELKAIYMHSIDKSKYKDKDIINLNNNPHK